MVLRMLKVQEHYDNYSLWYLRRHFLKEWDYILENLHLKIAHWMILLIVCRYFFKKIIISFHLCNGKVNGYKKQDLM